MRMNRSWTVAAVLGLAGISFLGGCGSERKADAPPATSALGPDKTATAPKVTSPSPEAAGETPPVSPLIKNQKPERDLGTQSLKRPSPPKAMARPAQAPKIVSALPHKIEQENNPMRPTAVPPPETNPIRPGIPLAEERDSAKRRTFVGKFANPQRQEGVHGRVRSRGSTSAASAGGQARCGGIFDRCAGGRAWRGCTFDHCGGSRACGSK